MLWRSRADLGDTGVRAWVAEVCLEHHDRDCGVCDGHDDDLWIDPRDLLGDTA
jgi:hypothetical protein